LLAHVLPAPARFATKKGSSALTSFGARGILSRSSVLPIPSALQRTICGRPLSAPEVFLPFTQCGWLGSLLSPLSGLLGAKVGSTAASARRRRAQHR
jgi:hypothetical protein